MIPIYSSVPQESVLGSILYLLYIADLATNRITTVAIFEEDTAILASHIDPAFASKHLQTNLNKIQIRLKEITYQSQCNHTAHTTFTLRSETFPPVTLNNAPLLQVENSKYLVLHFDWRLIWRKAKSNVLLLNPIWTCGRCQNKVSVLFPYYVPNEVISVLVQLKRTNSSNILAN